MSTPLSGPLSVTPLYTAAGDILVFWDGSEWQQIAVAGGGSGSPGAPVGGGGGVILTGGGGAPVVGGGQEAGGSSVTVTFVESAGTSVTLAAGTPVNLTTLALGAGDWMVSGSAQFVTGTAVLSTLMLGASSASGALPGVFYYSQISPGGVVTGGNWSLSIPEQRFHLTASATVYLVAEGSFGSGSVVTASGHLQARGFI